MRSDWKLGDVYVFTNEYASIGWIQKEPETSKVPYQQASVYGGPFNSKFWAMKTDENGLTLGAQSWPCQKPPWGRLTAVNVATGEFAWQVRLGVTDELPEGKRNTGRIGFGGPIVTAGGVLFIGATNDRRFRAFDSKTGKQLWETKLDYSAIAVPITFQGKKVTAVCGNHGRQRRRGRDGSGSPRRGILGRIHVAVGYLRALSQCSTPLPSLMR